MPHHSYLLQTVLLIYCILPFCKVIILIIYHNKQGIKKNVSKAKKKKKMKQNSLELKKMTPKVSEKFPAALLFIIIH